MPDTGEASPYIGVPPPLVLFSPTVIYFVSFLLLSKTSLLDELDKAKKKLKLVEFTSDIQTEDEIENNNNKPSKRKIKKNYRYVSSSDEDDDNDYNLSRPPQLKKPVIS
ncbi:hypothetical protein ACJJTC_019270, partial [Scirpophaga incertulas]